jgi:hypothetical protein
VKAWSVEYSRTGSGAAPVAQFLDRLSAADREDLIDLIGLLGEFGVALGAP